MDYSDTGEVTGTLVATNDIVIPPGAEASTSNSGCEASDFAPASDDRAAGRADPARHLRLLRQGAERPGRRLRRGDHLQRGSEGPQETLAGTLSADDTSTIPVIGTSFAIGKSSTQPGQRRSGHRSRVDHDRDPERRSRPRT